MFKFCSMLMVLCLPTPPPPSRMVDIHKLGRGGGLNRGLTMYYVYRIFFAYQVRFWNTNRSALVGEFIAHEQGKLKLKQNFKLLIMGMHGDKYDCLVFWEMYVAYISKTSTMLLYFIHIVYLCSWCDNDGR